MVLPRQRPATMRIGSGAEISQPGLQPRDALILVPLEPKGDVERTVDVDLTDAMSERPAKRLERLVVGLETELESSLPDDPGWRGEPDSSRDEHGRRVAHAARL